MKKSTKDEWPKWNNNMKNKYLPIPIIHVNYLINARLLSACCAGNPLPLTSVNRAADVIEKLLKVQARRNEWQQLDYVLNSDRPFYILGFPERIGVEKDCNIIKKDNIPHEFTILWDKHTYN